MSSENLKLSPHARPGERNGACRLTVEDVYVIRSLHSVLGLSKAEIGRRFGISREHARDIVNRKAWQHV